MHMETNLVLRDKCGTRIELGATSMIMPITDKKFFDDSVIYSRLKSDRIKATVKWNPMDPNHEKDIEDMFWSKSTLNEMMALHPKMDPRMFDLKQKLLEFGGNHVCLPGYEEDIDNILEYGQFWIGNNIKMMKGEPCHCHYNASRLWETNKDKSRICTGYALSEDGIWRQHSWVIWMKPKSNQIVETTIPRVAYFGFVMTSDQCRDFADENF